MTWEELFSAGTLQMASSPIDITEMPVMWADCTVNRILTVVAVLTWFVFLGEMLRMTPLLCECLPRWRANVTLQHSINQARIRNYLAIVSIFSLCIVADRYGLYRPSFLQHMPQWSGVPVMIGVVSLWLLLRRAFTLVLTFEHLHHDDRRAAHTALYNYFILLTVLIFVSMAVAKVFDLPDSTTKLVILIETGCAFMLNLVRTGQILVANCSRFSTFLYLCALELLPAGILIFSSTR